MSYRNIPPAFDWSRFSATNPLKGEGGMRLASSDLTLQKEAPQALAEELDQSQSQSGATILVVDNDDRSNIKHITNKFVLGSMSIQRQEKAQLVETLGTSSVSFFGDSVKVYTFSGQAVDYPSGTSTPHESMHQSSLLRLYDNHLRGTKLVKTNKIGVLKVMNHLIYGYPMNLNSQYQAGQDKIASFRMS